MRWRGPGRSAYDRGTAHGRRGGARTHQDMRVTGVIQAGGKSTRMGGRAKALLELGGRRIIDRVASVMAAVTSEQLVVTNTPELYAFLGLPLVPDVFPDHGSLGGIYSGL